jgi:hypothetical protein
MSDCDFISCTASSKSGSRGIPGIIGTITSFSLAVARVPASDQVRRSGDGDGYVERFAAGW